MSDNSNVIKHLRDLLRRLEEDDQNTSAIVCWLTDGYCFESIECGSPVLADAMLVHLMRVSILRSSPQPVTDETRQ